MRVCWVAIVLCVTLSVPTSARSSGSWTIVESRTMRVITDGSPELAGRLLDELEATRSALQQIAAAEPALPIDVFALKDAQSFSAFAPRQLKRGDIHTFGFSYTGPHTAFIALRTDRPESTLLETLRHEYMHVLTAAQAPEAPAWLDEGLAEFWAALARDDDRVVAGRPVAKHVDLLQRKKWLSVKSMSAQRRGQLPSNQDTLPVFYAQAWASIHYLLLGDADGNAIGFMPEAPALPSEQVLRRYVGDAQFREIPVPLRPARPQHRTVSTVSEARALAERANLMLSGSDPKGAVPVARKSLALNAHEPLALEVIGAYHFLINEPQQARGWLDRAIVAGEASYRAAIYLSLLAATPEDRERYLTLAVARMPASEVAWQRLAAIYDADGRLAQALRWCSAWSQHPDVSRWIPHVPCAPGDR